MSKSKKKLEMFFVILMILAIISVSQINSVYAIEPVNSDEVLYFLSDVVKLDMTKYNAELTLGPFTEYRDDLRGLSLTHGKFSLKSEDSTIDILFTFINGSLVNCQMNIRSGVPVYSKPKLSNIRESVNGFLQRYQSRTGDSTLSAMQSILDVVDVTKNVTKVSGDLKLEVTITPYSTASIRNSFRWSNVFNGAVFSTLGVSFINDDFYNFGDDRSYVQIGSTDVKVSKEEAVGMALGRAKSFSYTFGGKEISNFTVLQDRITAQLLTKAKDKPLVLYPYWMVTLPLGELYPGFVSMIVVEIWADTVEVASVYPLGIGGGEIPSGNAALTPEPSTSPSLRTEPSDSVSPSQSVLPSQSAESSALATTPPQPSVSPSLNAQPTVLSSSLPAGDAALVDFLSYAVAIAAALIVVVTAAVFFRKRASR